MPACKTDALAQLPLRYHRYWQGTSTAMLTVLATRSWDTTTTTAGMAMPHARVSMETILGALPSVGVARQPWLSLPSEWQQSGRGC